MELTLIVFLSVFSALILLMIWISAVSTYNDLQRDDVRHGGVETNFIDYFEI